MQAESRASWLFEGFETFASRVTDKVFSENTPLEDVMMYNTVEDIFDSRNTEYRNIFLGMLLNSNTDDNRYCCCGQSIIKLGQFRH